MAIRCQRGVRHHEGENRVEDFIGAGTGVGIGGAGLRRELYLAVHLLRQCDPCRQCVFRSGWGKLPR